MKKGIKKLGIVAVAAGLTALALGGCGNSKKADSGEKTITVSVDKNYYKYAESVKGEFEKENHCKVVVKKNPTMDTLQKLSQDEQSGNAADVMLAPYDQVGTLAKQGLLANVTLPTDGRYNSRDKQNVTLKGKQYGDPATIETLVEYYNKDLVKDAPTTFDQLSQMAKDPKYAYAHDKSKNVAFLCQWTNFYNAYGVIKAYGGYVFGDNNTNPKQLGLDTPGAVEGIKNMTSWFNIWPKGMQATTSNENFITSQFTKGKTAVVIDGPWTAQTYKKDGMKDNLGVAALPMLPGNRQYQPFAGGKAWVVNARSNQKALAKKFINYLTTEKNQTLFYKDTQEIPANDQSRAAAVKSGDPLAVAVNNQYQKSDPMPNIPEMTEVWTGAQNLLVNAASGKETPEQAAKQATKQIKQQIKQKYHVN